MYSARAAPHCCEGGLHLGLRLRGRVGLRLDAGPLEITWVVAWLHSSSNQPVIRTTPLVLSAIFVVSSRLHWELVEKLQLPTSAVFVEVPYRTFAWFPPNLLRMGLFGSPRT